MTPRALSRKLAVSEPPQPAAREAASIAGMVDITDASISSALIEARSEAPQQPPASAASLAPTRIEPHAPIATTPTIRSAGTAAAILSADAPPAATPSPGIRLRPGTTGQRTPTALRASPNAHLSSTSAQATTTPLTQRITIRPGAPASIQRRTESSALANRVSLTGPGAPGGRSSMHVEPIASAPVPLPRIATDVGASSSIARSPAALAEAGKGLAMESRRDSLGFRPAHRGIAFGTPSAASASAPAIQVQRSHNGAMPSAVAPISARRTPLTRAQAFDTITHAAQAPHAADAPDIGPAPHTKPSPIQLPALQAMPMPVRATPSTTTVQRRASPSEAMTAQGGASHALAGLGDGWHLHDRAAELGAATQQAQDAPEVSKSAAPAANLDELVERACTRLLDRLAVEQERRGVTRWL